METVGARAGFLLAGTRAAQSGQTSVEQGHACRGEAESNDVARCLSSPEFAFGHLCKLSSSPHGSVSVWIVAW